MMPVITDHKKNHANKSSARQLFQQNVPKNVQKDFWTRFELVLGVLLIAGIILTSVVLIRLNHNKPAFPIGESYYNLRIVDELKQNPLMKEDSLQGRAYYFNPYHYLLLGLNVLISEDNIMIFLPIILGVLSIFLFFKLLLTLGFSDKNAAYASVIASFTPAFIILFSSLQSMGFVLLLSLASLVILLEKKQNLIWEIISVFVVMLFLAIIILISLPSAIITLVAFTVLAGSSSQLKNKKNLLFAAWFFCIILALGLFFFTNYSATAASRHGFHPFSIAQAISIFGATMGFDLFLLSIFLIGALFAWPDKEKRLYHLGVLFFIALAFFNSLALVFASFIIVPYCAEAISHLYKRKWDLQIVKSGTIILLFCAVLFSGVSQVSMLVNSLPDADLRSALSSMKSTDPGVVLSDPGYGFFIEFYTHRKAFLDDNSQLYVDYKSKLQLSSEMFQSSRLNEADPLLHKVSVIYILLTPDMKEAFWESREEKLWLLMEYSGDFDNKFQENGIEVWEHKLAE